MVPVPSRPLAPSPQQRTSPTESTAHVCASPAETWLYRRCVPLPVTRTGVDFISVGALTHSVTVFDLGLDLTDEAGA